MAETERIPLAQSLANRRRAAKTQLNAYYSEAKLIRGEARDQGRLLLPYERRRLAVLHASAGALRRQIVEIEAEIASLPTLTLPQKASLKDIKEAKYLLHMALAAGLPEPLATNVALFLSRPPRGDEE